MLKKVGEKIPQEEMARLTREFFNTFDEVMDNFASNSNINNDLFHEFQQDAEEYCDGIRDWYYSGQIDVLPTKCEIAEDLIKILEDLKLRLTVTTVECIDNMGMEDMFDKGARYICVKEFVR